MGFTRQAVLALSAKFNEPDWMLAKRLEAFEMYASLPMPTTRDEAWRRTDIRALNLDAIGPSLNGQGGELDQLVLPLSAEEVIGRLVQVDGAKVQHALDAAPEAEGVIFCDMHTAVQRYPDLVRPHFMTEAVLPEAGKFAALHGAFWRGGTFLYLPAGAKLAGPLYSLLWATAGKTFSHTLVVLEPGSSAKLVNEYASRTEPGQALHNGAVELILRADAKLDFVSLQEWGRDVWQFTHERARIGRNAELNWVVSSLGSRLSKAFQTIELDGQGAGARMSGLFFSDGNQHLDHDTQQNHNMPDTTSDLLYKGALKGSSRSVWQGMIKVLPNAQRTNGYQANRNLILEESARADSIPGLEIEADDVRCTHGATVGQVDEDQVFYLMSRGLPRTEAVRLVVGGFFAPIMARIPLPSVRERLEAAIAERV